MVTTQSAETHDPTRSFQDLFTLLDIDKPATLRRVGMNGLELVAIHMFADESPELRRHAGRNFVRAYHELVNLTNRSAAKYVSSEAEKSSRTTYTEYPRRLRPCASVPSRKRFAVMARHFAHTEPLDKTCQSKYRQRDDTHVAYRPQ